MSSTSSPSSSTPSGSIPTPSQSGDSNQNAPESSALYLFTFLATLLLLLAVSCAIVVRSFILRRRFRRRIEEAIAAGVLIPGTLEDGPGGAMGRRRRDFGEKPKLWNVWVDEHGHFHEGMSDHGHDMKDEGKWESILPVSATMIPSSDSKTAPASNDDQANTNSTDASRRPAFFSRMLSRRGGAMMSPPQERNESSAELDAKSASERGKDDDALQVSVFISMPNPNARRFGSESDASFKGKERSSTYDEEGELPDVVFGVAEVRLGP